MNGKVRSSWRRVEETLHVHKAKRRKPTLDSLLKKHSKNQTVTEIAIEVFSELSGLYQLAGGSMRNQEGYRITWSSVMTPENKASIAQLAKASGVAPSAVFNELSQFFGNY